MRILHVSEAFGGGLRSAIVNYVRGADAHEHHLFVRTRVGHETFDVPESTTVVTFDGSTARFLLDARKMVLAGDFDIVHLHSSYAGLLRAMLPSRIRVVYSPHCYATETGRPTAKRALYWAIERVLASRDQMLMAVSPREVQLGQDLRAWMPSREVPNAATPMAVYATPSAADRRPVVVMLGRIAEQKDPRFFADVARLVGAERCEFVWIGEGERGREHLDAAGVRVTGWLTPMSVREHMMSASLYLHTAAWEGAPLSTLEAAEMGLPVLSRTIPSMVSLGYPLAGATPADVASSVERFLDDPDYREQVHSETKEIAASFSFDRMSARLVEAYEFAYTRPSVTR